MSVLAAALLTLAACSAPPATRYLIEAAPSAEQAPVRLRVRTIELRDISLPAYGEGSQILREGSAGVLMPIRGAEWADGSSTAITGELARRLDLRSSATVAAEPWPLADPADLRLEVRLSRVVARADGRFQLAGQFAVSAPEGQIRDFIEQIDISVPMSDDENDARAVAEAYGRALEDLAEVILARLTRR
ncbi:MAG: membrane integrity-associated transporter subunit PqiC [Pararhodobacter sp.]|nr:membrane integrity-associated transporter subunit PqiC [Pararhodobacter sp.]